MKKIIYYLSRVLSILIIVFFAMFILEGFGPDFGWQASVMHLALTLVALAATVLAWKKPKIGGWVFVIFGLWYLRALIAAEWLSGFIVGGVPLLVGILFLIEGFKKKD